MKAKMIKVLCFANGTKVSVGNKVEVTEEISGIKITTKGVIINLSNKKLVLKSSEEVTCHLSNICKIKLKR